MPPAKNLTFAELSQYFHLPISQVAKKVGVCATILKKICRKNGIARWPHRKIRSIDKAIANLEMNISRNPLEQNPEEREELIREIELLKEKRLQIIKNPNIIVKNTSNLDAHRQKMLLSNKKQSISYPISSYKQYEMRAGGPYDIPSLHSKENGHLNAMNMDELDPSQAASSAASSPLASPPPPPPLPSPSPPPSTNQYQAQVLQHPPKFTIPATLAPFFGENMVTFHSTSQSAALNVLGQHRANPPVSPSNTTMEDSPMIPTPQSPEIGYRYEIPSNYRYVIPDAIEKQLQSNVDTSSVPMGTLFQNPPTSSTSPAQIPSPLQEEVFKRCPSVTLPEWFSDERSRVLGVLPEISQ